MKLEEKIEEIKKMYNDGSSQKRIAQSFGCAQSHIRSLLKINDIKLRQPKTTKKLKYIKNLDFFIEINCEANAYFLGLLYADGCVCSTKESFEINLQEKDAKILEIFRNYISPQYKLRFIKSKNPNWQNKVVMRINSEIICEQLIKLGCVPRKSLILQFPDCVPDQFLNHFIRGCSDGDGSIYQENTGSKSFKWKLTSTYMFLTPIKLYIENKVATTFRSWVN